MSLNEFISLMFTILFLLIMSDLLELAHVLR